MTDDMILFDENNELTEAAMNCLYELEAFTDEEIELITETTVVCLDQLMTPTQQGEF